MSKKHKRSQKALHLNLRIQMMGIKGNNLKFVNGNLIGIDFMSLEEKIVQLCEAYLKRGWMRNCNFKL